MKPNILKTVRRHLHFQKSPFFGQLTILMLLTLGILIYSSSLPNPFIWDDFELIIHNPLVRGWSHIPKLFAGNVVENSSFYRPVQMLSYIFDYEIWGINAKGFRLTNILLHASAAACLCWFLVVITRNRLTGLLAGLLFLVHPVHNEAVAYVSGRAELLVAIFLLLSFILYVGYLEKGRLTDYLFCVGCFLLALLSKEYALILPVLILAYHLVFSRKINRELFFMLVALAVMYGTLRLYNVIGVADMHEKTPTILLQRLPGSFYAQGMYLKLLIFPNNLFLGYGQKLYTWSNPMVWGGLFVWGGILAAALVFRTRRPYLSFFLWWYVVGIFPVMNIYPVNAYMAEHWLYIPAMGMIALTAHVLSCLSQRKRLRTVVYGGVTLILVLLSLQTHRQNYFWRDPIAFYQRIVAINPQFVKAYNNLGKLLSQEGKFEQAAGYFLKSIEIDPRFVKGYHNYAVCMAKIGRPDTAVEYYHKALSVAPNFAPTYNNLGALYIDQQEFDLAEQYVNRALSLRPQMPKAYYNLGLIAQARSDKTKARQFFEMALRYDPNYPEAKNNLGSLLGQEGMMEQAIEQYKQVLAVEPRNYSVMNNLGILYGKTGQEPLAMEYFGRALQIKPDFADAHFNIGYAFARQNRWGQAMRHYQDAVRYNPKHQQAINNLAIIYAQQNRFKEAEALFETALQLNPADFSAHNNLGLVYSKQGKLELAKQQYQKALSINPAHKETHNNLAMLYDTSGQMAEAERHYLEALKVDPNFANALNGLGIVYGKQHKYKEAEGMFLRTLKVNPERQDALNNLERARQLNSKAGS